MRVHHLTDSNGAILEKYVYDGYGRRTILTPQDGSLTNSAVGNRIGFQGREHEELTGPVHEDGLTYHRNRFYSPGSGRFNAPDSIGYEGGPNLYGFAGGNPVNAVDPLGESWRIKAVVNAAGSLEFSEPYWVDDKYGNKEESPTTANIEKAKQFIEKNFTKPWAENDEYVTIISQAPLIPTPDKNDVATKQPKGNYRGIVSIPDKFTEERTFDSPGERDTWLKDREKELKDKQKWAEFKESMGGLKNAAENPASTFFEMSRPSTAVILAMGVYYDATPESMAALSNSNAAALFDVLAAASAASRTGLLEGGTGKSASFSPRYPGGLEFDVKFVRDFNTRYKGAINIRILQDRRLDAIARSQGYDPAKVGAAFVAEENTILLRKGATHFDFWHEFLHWKQFQELGPAEYGKLKPLAREQYVYEGLRKHFWNLMGKGEREASDCYIKSKGGKAW
jgi:RHS repeat-associated protein